MEPTEFPEWLKVVIAFSVLVGIVLTLVLVGIMIVNNWIEKRNAEHERRWAANWALVDRLKREEEEET